MEGLNFFARMFIDLPDDEFEDLVIGVLVIRTLVILIICYVMFMFIGLVSYFRKKYEEMLTRY